MKIAILCHYSHPSICGVWNSVFNLSKMLKDKHEIHVLSSNIIKGTNRLSKEYENLDGIHIHRFKVKYNFGAEAHYWPFKGLLNELKPDIIHSHVYRHPHSTIVPFFNKPCILTTHAPFLERNLRTRKMRILIRIYDQLLGKIILKKYNKVIAITKWELTILKRFKLNNLVYIPNGVDDSFFSTKVKQGSYVLYFGRIDPIKNLETLIRAFNMLKDQRLILVGPSEKAYLEKLKRLANSNIEFRPAVYDINEKIKLYNNSRLFVLPSKREAMPQSLIEAMALGKPVIASNNIGCKEIIDKKYIFETYNHKQLSALIKKTLIEKPNPIKYRKLAEKYKLSNVVKQIEDVYHESITNLS